MRSLIFCEEYRLLTKYYWGDQIKKNEMDGHVARVGRGEVYTGF
jgi:hypothetical protein